MFQFLGYNFFKGDGALNPAPAQVDNITSTRLSNAIYDHFNVTKDIKLYGDSNIPDGWTYDTILNAGFNGNTNAGNLDYVLDQLTGIKIKRRVKGTFDWITLKYIPITGPESFSFVYNDFLNAYDTEYDYAIVPMAQNIEGDYIINSVLSRFNGIFIVDSEQSFKLLYGDSYGSNSRNQQTQAFTPLGRKFPIVVANGISNYETGSVSATILNQDYDETRVVDRAETTKRKNAIKDFLANKKPKVLKDYNGNIWLIMVVDNIGVSYLEGSTMGIPNIQFNWAEIGKADDQKDLYTSGLVDSLG